MKKTVARVPPRRRLARDQSMPEDDGAPDQEAGGMKKAVVQAPPRRRSARGQSKPEVDGAPDQEAGPSTSRS